MYSRKDSNFGWLIVAASFLSHFFQYGIVWTVGVFYVIFLEHIGGSSGAVALISSLNTAMFYSTGPLAGAITNVYGARKVALVGGIIGCAGLALSAFATTLIHLYCTFGILAGFGLGLSYIPSVTIVGQYFEKKRSLALGLAVSGIGMGTFTFPPIIRLLNEMFGWRGCILVIAGISLNICVCAAMFRPFNERGRELEENKFVQEKLLIQKNSDIEKNKSMIKRLIQAKRALNLYIFQNSAYLALCVNNIFATFGLAVVYVHLASYAISLGFRENEAALLFSAMGISNFIGRVVYGFLGHLPCFSPISLYSGGFFLAGAVIGLTPYAQSYMALMVCAAGFGFLTGCFGTQLPQVVIQILDVEQLTSGYGYLLLFEAIGTLMGGPVAGWIYDQWHYYPASLFAGALFIFISCIVMLWPWYKVRQGSRKGSTSSIEEIKSEQPLTDYLDPHSALKKHVFLSMESLHSFVDESLSTAAT